MDGPPVGMLVRQGLGTPESPAQLPSVVSDLVCFLQRANKKKRLESPAEGEQEPLLGGPTASELLPPVSLWFSHQLRVWRGPSPGPGSDAC